MNESVKVSVLIAAYNKEKYIDQCLESAMNQTLREIEIIVVDDCSTDATLAHIKAAAERDSRVRVIRHEENRGTLQSRKDAVLASRGEYVMFMDNDDYLELDACRTVYENAIKSDADILQFGVSVENCGDLPMNTIEGINRFHNRYQGVELLGQPLVQNYTEDRVSVTVWQKAIKGETTKRAFKKMSAVHMDAGQDEYITCILLMESRILSKIPDKLYHYCYGRGVFGHQTVTPQEFSFHCKGVIAYNELKKYVSELSSDCGEEYIVAGQDAVEKLKKAVVNVSLKFFLNHMKPEDQPEGFLMMEQAWQMDTSSFIGLFAKCAWNKRAHIAEALAGADWLKYEGCPVKTIGLYYWRFRNGGAERVVTQLGSLLAELQDEKGRTKYRVVLISDEAPNEEDYPISPLVMREELPPFRESTGENYAPRAEKWQKIIAKHRIDTVFYSQWAEPILLWDLLSVKRAEGHPAFVIHAHSYCATQYQWQAPSMKERLEIFRLADGIVTLSETDRLYWSRCNPRSVYIPNPCFVKTGECRRSAYSKHILWLGRIASEKQPLEIPRIMREVCARDPEIVCHVVGAYDAKLEKELQERIAAEGLSENILLEDFHADVTPFYEKSSLFLMTSRYEGFAVTLFEAASYGLPTVLYELPWLSYNELIDGAVTVPQLDAEAAAEAIVHLVNDPEEWQRRSDAIYNSALRYEETDITAYWTSLIESLEKGTLPETPRFDCKTELLLDRIDELHDEALSTLDRKRDQERKKAKNMEQKLESQERKLKSQERKLKSREMELNSIHASVSFRIGRAITWLPRKVRGGIRCYREHGIAYTARQFVKHLTGKA